MDKKKNDDDDDDDDVCRNLSDYVINYTDKILILLLAPY